MPTSILLSMMRLRTSTMTLQLHGYTHLDLHVGKHTLPW